MPIPEPSTASLEATALEEPAVEELNFKEALSQALSEQFSGEGSLASPRGMVEAVLPMTVFSIVFGVVHDLRISLIAGIVPALIMSVWRLLRRETIMQSVSGLLGIGIGAVFALRTGRAQDVFVPGMLKSAGIGALYAVSALLRWPLVGVMIGFTVGEQFHWRSVPERAQVYSRATWAWVGMFTFRLAVQIPLYLTGSVVALGVVNILLGLPLFAIMLWLTWVLVRRVPVALPPAGETITPATADDEAAIVIRSDEALG